MSKLSVLNTKRVFPSLCILGVSALLLFALWGSGFLSYADTGLYDFFLGLKVKYSPRPLNPQIIPVDLNDRSEMNLGGRIADRSAFADLFAVIGHSNAAAALDFIYQGGREGDAAMIEAASSLRFLVTAIIPVPEGRENVSYSELLPEEAALLRRHLWRPRESGVSGVKRAGTFVMPFMGLGEAAKQLAHLSIDPDTDGIYRRTPLFYAWEDGLVPSVSLAAAVLELGVDGNDLIIHWGREVIIPLGPGESVSIPIDSAGNVVVPFGGKWADTTHRFSMDILAGSRYDEEQLALVRNDLLRSLCFVADTTFAKKDIGPVPMEEIYPLSGLHTWVISAIFDASLGEDFFFRESAVQYRIICLVLFAALFFVLGMTGKDRLFNGAAAAVFFLFSALTLYLWFSGRVIPWYTPGALFLLFCWFFGFVHRFLTQQKRQSALERYVPRAVAQKLVAGQRTGLVPVYKELTVLFSDIAGFTAWSSGREARIVHDFLNDYLGSMADILFAHGATVDKFMGDGILAFFGDPLDMPDHAKQAAAAALAMQEKIRLLREEWKPKVGIDLKVRIGVNTGKVIVGDLGTQKRIEYTVIGSAVNLAQRMESLAPPGGILVTEDTRAALEKLAANFSFGGRRELEVKGYDHPVFAYEIMMSSSGAD